MSRKRSMQALWRIAAALVVAVLVVMGCAGSEVRLYFDDAAEASVPDASLDDDVLVTPTDGGTESSLDDADAGDAADAPDDADAAEASTTHKVGGTVAGLLGSGLVLQLNGGDDVVLNAVDGGASMPFVFATQLGQGDHFAVTIKTQPSGPTQSCAVYGDSGNIGTGDVGSVFVNCAAGSYVVGGTVTGLEGSITLENNAANPLVLTTDGPFAFSAPLGNGAGYLVTIDSHSSLPVQTCNLTGGSGSVMGANVSSVSITCTTSTYTVGGTASFDGGGPLILSNGANLVSVGANGPFTFSAPVLSNRTYDVQVVTAPTNQTCPITNGSGTVTNANVNNVSVACVPQYALQENFDGVTAPALPAGWTNTVQSGNGNISVFVTTSTASATGSLPANQTPPNSCGIVENTANTDIVLVSPTFKVATSNAKLTFRQAYALEASQLPPPPLPALPIGYDGVVLEISIAGGAWTDIITAGGAWVTGGYTRQISSAYNSALANHNAWSGMSYGWITTTVSLPLTAGQSAQIRFRAATDKQNIVCDGSVDGGPPYYCEGWRVDTLAVTN